LKHFKVQVGELEAKNKASGPNAKVPSDTLPVSVLNHAYTVKILW